MLEEQFQTTFNTLSNYKTKAFFDLEPNQQSWTFDLLFIFLNQLHDDFYHIGRLRTYRNFLILGVKAPLHKKNGSIIIKFDLSTESIFVKAHSNVLFHYFIEEHDIRPTIFRSRHRLSAFGEHAEELIRFYIKVGKRKDGDLFIRNGEKSLFLKRSAFHTSIQKICSIIVPFCQNIYLGHIFLRLYAFFMQNKKVPTLKSLEDFQRITQGFLNLHLIPAEP
jgi:hypothetical protein